jgi:glucosamine--fructose-6-phosphate aminotransferase (isomerizing)
MLRREAEVAELARRYCGFKNFMFIGRGINYPVALEGALKLKEVSYVHAEGTSAGALKHGPIALLDQDFPVIAICTDSATREKVAGNVHEVAARGAPVLALVTEGDHSLDGVLTDRIEIPAGDEAAVAILNTVVLQLFAYHVAVMLGRDVDQPRNLAKSVTVE